MAAELRRMLFESIPPGVGQSSQRLDRLFENVDDTIKVQREISLHGSQISNRASDHLNVRHEAHARLRRQRIQLVSRRQTS